MSGVNPFFQSLTCRVVAVDKGASAALVRFCETGGVKTGPTTVGVRRKAFTS